MRQDFKLITRGGQTFLHAIRMMEQVMQMVILTGCVIFLISASMIVYNTTTQGERYLAGKWYQSLFLSMLSKKSEITLETLDHSKKMRVHVKSVLENSEYRKKINDINILFLHAILLSFAITLLLVVLMVYWLSKRGKQLEKSIFLQGTQMVSPAEFIHTIKKFGETGDLKFATIPLFKNAEKQHFLIHGSTGTGKSVLIRELLDQIRARGDKAIIYDKHGSFVSEYFREGKDILLNPLDERSAPWDVWAECRDAADFDSVAAALMPLPTGQASDPFWINAARTIFAATANKLKQDPQRCTAKLLKYLLTSNLEDISTLLKGTEAETLVSEKAEKTAISIKSVLATYLKSFKFLKNASAPFSIRHWVSDDNQRDWLFLASRADKHNTLKPLISTWLDIAVNALLSLVEDPNRRIWVIIDELPSLERLPYLPEAFAESRKFGGCLVAGMQSYFQLQKIYGQDGAKEIIDLCNIRAFFRAPSNDVSKWVSKQIGDKEQAETRDGISYGANTIRDGVSMNTQHTNKPAITPNEISHLPDLHAIICIPPTCAQRKPMKKTVSLQKNWPITLVKLTLKIREEICSRFVEASAAQTIDEIEHLFKTVEPILATEQDDYREDDDLRIPSRKVQGNRIFNDDVISL